MAEHKGKRPVRVAGIDRRTFVVSACGAAASWMLPLRAFAQDAATPFVVPDDWFIPFAEPESVEAADGVGGVDLVVRFADVVMDEPGDDGSVVERVERVRTYNGNVPGPTFRLSAGDRLELKVVNDLPPNEPAPPPYDEIDDCHMLMALNVPGCFNTTNLHTHGLHVSPTTDEERGLSSDDVLVKIAPKNDPFEGDQPSERAYCIWLPAFHAPGTHWYHAHVHGSTSVQVVNGLAGALIVEEPEEQKIEVDAELIWVIQEVLDEAESIYANISVPAGQPGAGEKPYGDTPPSVRFTVNTRTSPTIRMRPNEIQRWRWINATGTPRGFMEIAVLDANDPSGNFVDGALHLIAEDGITFYGKQPQPVVAPGHFFSPGNRADVLARFSEPGTYYVWKRKVDDRRIGGLNPTTNELLAIVQVEGDAMAARPLPRLPALDKAPCYLQPISDEEVERTARRTFEFGVVGPAAFGGFTINGESYGRLDPETGEPLPPPNTDVPLGDAEEWTLTNASGASHPFHIHVNPFQVVGDKVDPDGPDDPSNWRWLDTVRVPPDGSLRIRSRFLTYDGAFVLHCHILVHEDAGMMQDVTVVGDGAGPCVAVAECRI